MTIQQDRINLNSEKYNTKSFEYPSDLATDGNGKVVVFHIYTPVESELVGMKESGLVADAPVIEREGNSIQSTAAISNKYRYSDTSIALHMPDNISASYGTDWQTTALGGAAGFANTASSLDDINKSMVGTAMKEGLHSAVTGVLQQLSPLNTQDTANKLRSQVKNPYMEVLFNGGVNRTFSFNFKFTPRSLKEAQAVKDIIYQFKLHQSPEYKYSNQGLQSYLLYPSQFDIIFIQENGDTNDWIHKISTCVVTNMTVDYTAEGGGFRTFDGGDDPNNDAPVQTNLILEFTELEILTKDRIIEGY
jgi:hypothetical protein